MQEETKNLIIIAKSQSEEIQSPLSEEFMAQIQKSIQVRQENNSKKLSDHLQKNLTTGDNSSIATPLDIVTPQEALSKDFFDLPISDTTANSSLISMVSTTSVNENFSSKKFSLDFNIKIALNEKQLASIENETSKELEVFLQNAVTQLPPVNPATANRFVDSIPSLLNPFNIELCLSAASGIFPVFLIHEMIMRLASGDIFTRFINLKFFINYFKPYLLKITNVIIWSQFNFVGVNSVHTILLSSLNRAVHILSPVALTPFFSSQLVENIAFRRNVLKEHLTLKTQSFFHKVGLIKILFFTLTTAAIPFIVPLLRKFISDQLFLLANKSKECLHNFTDEVIKEVLTEKRIIKVIDKVLESVRDHPSNPRVILEEIPLNLI